VLVTKVGYGWWRGGVTRQPPSLGRSGGRRSACGSDAGLARARPPAHNGAIPEGTYRRATQRYRWLTQDLQDRRLRLSRAASPCSPPGVPKQSLAACLKPCATASAPMTVGMSPGNEERRGDSPIARMRDGGGAEAAAGCRQQRSREP